MGSGNGAQGPALWPQLLQRRSSPPPRPTPPQPELRPEAFSPCPAQNTLFCVDTDSVSGSGTEAGAWACLVASFAPSLTSVMHLDLTWDRRVIFTLKGEKPRGGLGCRSNSRQWQLELGRKHQSLVCSGRGWGSASETTSLTPGPGSVGPKLPSLGSSLGKRTRCW